MSRRATTALPALADVQAELQAKPELLLRVLAALLAPAVAAELAALEPASPSFKPKRRASTPIRPSGPAPSDLQRARARSVCSRMGLRVMKSP